MKLDEEAVTDRGAEEVNKAIAEWRTRRPFHHSERELFVFAFSKGAAFGADECHRLVVPCQEKR